jgi:hypothetical protein
MVMYTSIASCTDCGKVRLCSFINSCGIPKYWVGQVLHNGVGWRGDLHVVGLSVGTEGGVIGGKGFACSINVRC